MPKPTDHELDHRFQSRAATPEQSAAISTINAAALAFAKQLRDLCPEGRNLALVLTHLEDLRMRANAAVVFDGTTVLDVAQAAAARAQMPPHTRLGGMMASMSPPPTSAPTGMAHGLNEP